MRKNTAPIARQSPDTANENQLTVRVDAAGYVVSAATTRRKPEGLSFIQFIKATRDLYPIDRADIVMPNGWALGENGEAIQL
jgi:hypothetical protein